MTYVKICGLRNPADAEFAARIGADAIGLALHPASARRVSAVQAREIADSVRGDVEIVTFVVNRDEAFVRRVLEMVRPDVLQFHGSEPEVFCASFGHRYWKAIHVEDVDTVTQAALTYVSADALLAEAPTQSHGGSGKTFDWSLIPRERNARLLLAGGLSPDNVAEAIQTVAPWGVDVSSGVEVTRGVKSRELIAAFLEAVRGA